jgi:hypothetical protein
MGGSSGGGGRRTRTSGSASAKSGQPTGAGARGGTIPIGPECPSKLRAPITGPRPGIAAGSWLDVQLDDSAEPVRVVLRDPIREEIVGSISGIPGLAVLIQCLGAAVVYRAYVDRVDGGRVDVTLVRQ